MSNTKSNFKKFPHYELKTRMNAKDMMNFSYHLVVENELYKFSHYKHNILRIIAAVMIYPFILEMAVGIDLIIDNKLLRFILIFILVSTLVKLLFLIKDKNPKMTGAQAAAAVVDSTYTRLGKGEREVYFNLGKNGFSTDAIKKKGIMFYDYSMFRRTVECEFGIILILDSEQIICIPARCLDDESACFIIKKLRSKCRGRFVTTSKMKIEEAKPSQF